MDLASYINSFPRNRRMEIRRRLAAVHGVSEVAIRSWANGTRKHPCTREAVEVTERFTENRVSRFDLRPDIFGNKEA
jgi:DNA-binding transcriptional regulator YdaS (Cro superfamily)